ISSNTRLGTHPGKYPVTCILFVGSPIPLLPLPQILPEPPRSLADAHRKSRGGANERLPQLSGAREPSGQTLAIRQPVQLENRGCRGGWYRGEARSSKRSCASLKR